MKQKIVMKLPADDAKSRTKAMKIVAGLPGVTSATLEPNKIVVVGEVDSVQLTTRLRKKMGFTELESVSKVEEKKEGPKPQEKPSDPVTLPPGWPRQYGSPYPHVLYYEPAQEPYRDDCTIM